ncbi:MAG: hypothetical protein CVV35_08570 [Methanomicrobiales archaeon HGW-Methanomicrobiales-6]|nr:MAG: hypothetical protein CVV35_08570 [Methanomicrobiales archaeon HGW-Methanomicrobiales-6]
MEDVIVQDWNEVWKTRLALNRSTPAFREGADLWSGREQARRYADRSEAGRHARVAEALADLAVAPGDRVLDIGSGPGTLALPLARAGASVTAVDPAEGMLAALRAAAKRERITDITTFPGLWEEINPDRDLDPPYDRVVASFSLGMPDRHPITRSQRPIVSSTSSLVWGSTRTS